MILFNQLGKKYAFSYLFNNFFPPTCYLAIMFEGQTVKYTPLCKLYSSRECWMQCRWTDHFGYHNSHNLAIQKIGPNPRPNAKKSCVEWILYTLSSLIFCLKSNFNLLMREIFLFLGQVFRSCQPPSSCRPPWSPRTDAQNSHVLVLGIIRQGQFCINP